MNAVYGSIIENLKLIEIIYEPTVESFKNDKTNTSDSKELTVNQFVGSYLPSDFQIKSQSKIYSKTQETNNIDCVILAPNHPKLITPKREIILAEGVFAAIEVKPDISTLTIKSEFFRGLKQIKSIKNIERKVERLDFLDSREKSPSRKYDDKIPAVLFASKSAPIEKTVDFIRKKVADRTFNHDELPDLIVTLDKGVLIYSPHLKDLPLAKILKNKGIIIPEKGFISIKSEKKEMNLINFLRILLSYSSPTIQVSKFIIKDYLKVIGGDKLDTLYPLESIS